MMRLFRQWWWKLLCIPLLLFAFTAGILTPLGPGILRINPDTSTRGTNISVDIFFYNTHFKEDDQSLNVVLKNETNTICNNQVTVISPTHLNVEFGIDPTWKIVNQKDYYTLIIYNEQDGTFFLADAFSISRQDTVTGYGFKCTTDLKVLPAKGYTFPNKGILYETIRNLFFHVPMWFAMIFLVFFSFICSIVYLAIANRQYDLLASSAAGVGTFFGVLGVVTGMQWAKFTWGEPWPDDPKLNGVAFGMLIYLAYFVLRASITDGQIRARVSSVYSILGFVMFLAFVYIIPKKSQSLHPGMGGNPAFKFYDQDTTMLPVFWSACAGFIILGMWLFTIVARYRILSQIQSEKTLSK